MRVHMTWTWRRVLVMLVGLVLGGPVGTLWGQGSVPHRQWSAGDRVLLGAAWSLILVDWAQTRTMAQSNWTDPSGTRHYEGNILFLTDHPKPLHVDLMAAGAAVGTYWLANQLHRKSERAIFLGAVIVLEAAAVTFNHQGGVRIRL